MTTKRTVHGEALQQREPGGHGWRRVFWVAQVWCPACHAQPGRRCTWTAEELTGRPFILGGWTGGLSPEAAKRRAAKLNKGGIHSHHRARWLRSEELARVAKAGCLWALAAPTQHATTAGLPLFDRGA